MVLKRNTLFFSATKIKQNVLQDFEYSFDLNNDKVEKVDNISAKPFLGKTY